MSAFMRSKAPPRSDATPAGHLVEAQGWVVRRRSETDKRALHLGLTARGAALVAKATERVLAGEQKAFASLSEGERIMLVELLHKVACSRPTQGGENATKA